MPESEWIVQRGEVRYPASDIAVLQQWATAGTIQPGDQVWSPLRGDWSPATETPEISELLVRSGGAVTKAPPMTVAATPRSTAARASVGLRAAGYLIDAIPAAILGFVGLIPVLGQLIAGVLLGFYWLYRDAAPLSLGKMALGLQVVQANGEPATRQALTRRNLPFAIAGFITAIPILGIFLGPITAFVAFAVTVVLLVSEGYSLGDKWAGTTVIKRS
jgi:uncharacterized RDD family membrane protein YckC